jgi:4'-phosphopantetheinyl transferase
VDFLWFSEEVMQFVCGKVSESLSVASEEVHLWLVDFSDAVGGYRPYLSYLSPNELLRAQRFVHESSREQYVLSHAVLRMLLSRYLGRAHDKQEFVTTGKGKPGLPSGKLRFNLSHSHGCALIAVSSGVEVGVDIELVKHKEALDGLAQRFYAGAECAWLSSAESQQEYLDRFYHVWVCKEAYLKALGLGLAVSLKSFSVIDLDSKTLMPMLSSADGEKCYLASSLVQQAGGCYRLAYGSMGCNLRVVSQKWDFLVS